MARESNEYKLGSKSPLFCINVLHLCTFEWTNISWCLKGKRISFEYLLFGLWPENRSDDRSHLSLSDSCLGQAEIAPTGKFRVNLSFIILIQTIFWMWPGYGNIWLALIFLVINGFTERRKLESSKGLINCQLAYLALNSLTLIWAVELRSLKAFIDILLKLFCCYVI